MTSIRNIELLAPAKDLGTGIEAISHGADAVYIGASKFGARSAAGNSVEDIAKLTEYAHLFNAKVYVTVNTILYDEELPEAEALIKELYKVGVDALLVQDMSLLQLNLPPIPLHASTQMDIRTPEKVQFLEKAGFSQAVLARELSINEIKEIAQSCTLPLEVFVHGALCVSYSGQCYASQHCFGRSANRGECAQFCRLPFDLEDADGNVIEHNKHLLSLKDMNRSKYLEELLDAGVTSLKIEGRLKDVSYVKNITAYYRQQLDNIFKRRKEYKRASSGAVRITFTPSPEKSFNRGFTDYFLHKRTSDIFSFDTPKSLGEEMGRVKEIGRNWLTVAGLKPFANGDGLCYLDRRDKLQGFRVNRVETNKLFPLQMPDIEPRTIIYRNYSQAFEQLLAKKSAERKIGIEMELTENNFGCSLTLSDEDKNRVTVVLPMEKTPAKSEQEENVINQLKKLGDTPFECTSVKSSINCFVPTSQLAELRRNAVALLLKTRHINYPQKIVSRINDTFPYPEKQLSYLGNVLNAKAAAFYKNHGVEKCGFAFEKKEPQESVPIMFCRHCLRYSLGACPKYDKQRLPFREPFYLVSNKGQHFRLEFDCRRCLMKVYSQEDRQNGIQ